MIGPNAPAAKWELKLLPLDQIKAEMKGTSWRARAPRQPRRGSAGLEPGSPSASTETSAGNASAGLKPGATNPRTIKLSRPQEDLSQRAADGFLINGSVINGAASPFAQAFAFGNNRNGGRGLYNGGIGLIFDNSALDARPFSLSGQNTPKPAYNRITGVATLGGPLKIPHILPARSELFCRLPVDALC